MKALLVAFLLFATTAFATPLTNNVLSIASKDVGVVEKTNNNDGPRIDQYQKTAASYKGAPYCVAAVYTWYKEASDALKTKCPLPRVASSSLMWHIAKDNPSKYKVITAQQIVTGQEKVLPGDIIIWKTGAVSEASMFKGHGGLNEVQLAKKELATIEANTSGSNNVSAQREQSKKDVNKGGVYRKHRVVNNNINFLILGVIRVR